MAAISSLKDVVGLLEEGKNQEALDIIEKLGKEYPENADLLEKKGIALRLLGRYREALEAYDKALTLAPNSARIWYNRAVVFKAMAWVEKYAQGHEEAIKCYTKAIECDPTYFNGMLCMGNVHTLLKKYDIAKDWYSRAVMRCPEEADGWCNFSFLMARTREYPCALALSEKALSISPKMAPALVIKGACLKAMGKEEEARQAYDLATSLSPIVKERVKFETIQDDVGPSLRDEDIKA